MAKTEQADEYAFDDARDGILARVRAADLRWYKRPRMMIKRLDVKPEKLFVALPNGDNHVYVEVPARSAKTFANIPFEHLTVLGQYHAVLNTQSGKIEALLTPQLGVQRSLYAVLGLPGIETFDQDLETDEMKRVVYSQDDLATGRIASHAGFWWRLPIANTPIETEVEISPATVIFEYLADDIDINPDVPWLSMKLSLPFSQSHDEAVLLLEDVASSLLFELDVRYRFSFSLAHRVDDDDDADDAFAQSAADSRLVDYPRRHYSKPATTLYFYAKSATGVPLLQYLAFYQAIEYFFPTFVDREVMRRMRNLMHDPRFDDAVDDDMQRLIGYANRADRRGGSKEREMLKVTLEQSVEESDLRDFLMALPDAALASLENSKELTGIDGINMKEQERIPKLIAQVAERMYRLRCRIVHAKDAQTTDYVEALLPFSAESGRLGPDILLAEYLCQKVIIAGSTERS